MILYRAEMINIEEDFTPRIVYKEFIVIKETPKCYWLLVGSKRKLVLKNSDGKRFAYVSKELALNAMLIRRQRYQSILESKVKGNKLVIDVVKKTMIDPNYKFCPYKEYEIYI